MKTIINIQQQYSLNIQQYSFNIQMKAIITDESNTIIHAVKSQVGLSLLCFKVFQLFFLVILFFLPIIPKTMLITEIMLTIYTL